MAGRSTLMLHALGIVAAILLWTICEEEFATINVGGIFKSFAHSLLDASLQTLLKRTAMLAASLYVVYLVRIMYVGLFGEINIIYKQMERDVGYHLTPGMSKKDVANNVRRRRKIGDIPPVYPNGWFEVICSDELRVGEVKAVSMIGLHFGVFRGENGKACVMDAYCPHLGANLGVGGRVRGNCIECPFHGWTFDGETGKCVRIPYTSKIPSMAKTKVWPSVELNGIVFVWFDAEGRDPYFFLEEVPDICSGRCTFKSRSVHYVNCHTEDISENGADVAHLTSVHETGAQAGSTIDYTNKWLGKVLTHHWKLTWEALPAPKSHIGRMDLHIFHKLFNKWLLPFLNVDVIVDQFGPGMVVLTLDLLIGKVVFVQTVVSEAPLMQRLTHYLYCSWWMPAFIATRLFLQGDAIQIERDALIWGNKTYASKPMLVKEDQAILAHRRWFAQFYSENSPRLSFRKEVDLAW